MGHPPTHVSDGGLIDVNIVGGLQWNLEKKGDSLLLGPASVYTHEGATRENLWRELCMLSSETAWPRKMKQVLLTALRRLLTGELIIQDKYTATRDDAVLGISSNIVGGNIVQVDLSTELATHVLIARKGVYFGSQEGVKLRVFSPPGLGRKVYGPGLFFQMFGIADNYRHRPVLFLQIDSEVILKELAQGETLRLNTLNAYAWESSVDFSLIEFGSVVGRLLRGDLPYWVEFRGPGKIWYSSSYFTHGYIGWYFTPAYWIYAIREFVMTLPQRIFGSQ